MLLRFRSIPLPGRISGDLRGPAVFQHARIYAAHYGTLPGNYQQASIKPALRIKPGDAAVMHISVRAIRNFPVYRKTQTGDTVLDSFMKMFRLNDLPKLRRRSAVGLAASKAGTGKKEDESPPLKVMIVETWSWRRFIRKLGWGALLTILTVLGISIALNNQVIIRSGVGSSEVQPVHTEKPVTFADVQGVDEAKLELEDIAAFLKDPKRFLATGGKMPKGILLYGPPGTGKTYLARAVSGEAGVPFYQMSGSEFDELYVGVGARRVRDLFNIAKKNAPCMIFIDEIDAIGSKRSSRDHTYMRQTLNQLLVELDGFTSSDGVIFIGATNIPESLDKALIRSGRIDKLVPVPLPDVRGRAKIIEVHLSNIVASDGVDPISIARGTPGFSGADLANLINQAAIKASKDGDGYVQMKHIEWAKDNAIMGRENRSAIITEENKRMTAYHEAGHAIAAMYTKGSEPLHKVTVIPRGSSLGMTVQLPEADKMNHTKEELSAKIDVCLGGRCAEELIYGKNNVTTGSYSDLVKATQIADDMITRYGMSDRIGLLSYKEGFSPSPQQKAAIEQEMKRILDESNERVLSVLRTHCDELHRLSSSLVEHETLDLNEVKAILRGEEIKSLGDKLAEVVDEFKHKPAIKI